MPGMYISGAVAAAPPFRNDPSLACRTHDPDLWFPESRTRKAAATAKKLCGKCPRRDECLKWALKYREPYGIYGAKTANERAQILRDMQGRRS